MSSSAKVKIRSDRKRRLTYFIGCILWHHITISGNIGLIVFPHCPHDCGQFPGKDTIGQFGIFLLNIDHMNICPSEVVGFLADGIADGDFDNIFEQSVPFSLMPGDFVVTGLVHCFAEMGVGPEFLFMIEAVRIIDNCKEGGCGDDANAGYFEETFDDGIFPGLFSKFFFEAIFFKLE